MSRTIADHGVRGDAVGVFKTFLKLGLTSFGGPIAHLAYFRKEVVERQGWVSESQFSQVLAICQFLPGPASSQLGFSLGLLRAGGLGALAAFIAFTMPSVLLLLGFASLLPHISGPVGSAAVQGLKLVACAVVADAVLGMARKLCPDAPRGTLAVLAASFILLTGTAWAQIVVVLGGALAGVIVCREVEVGHDESTLQVPYGRPTVVALLAVFSTIFLLSWAPGQSGLQAIAQVFYRAGAMVFGGGHVVLPLLEDSVVTSGWVSQESFLAGYGAAQAIPGPLFSFSAYLGALIPTGQGSGYGAAVALVFMFLPGFLLVAAALPMWQAIAHQPRAAGAVAGVNAAVVGILAAALYDPIFTSGVTSSTDLAIAVLGFGMLTVWRLSPLWVVGWCVGANVLIGMF